MQKEINVTISEIVPRNTVIKINKIFREAYSKRNIRFTNQENTNPRRNRSRIKLHLKESKTLSRKHLI